MKSVWMVILILALIFVACGKSETPMEPYGSISGLKVNAPDYQGLHSWVWIDYDGLCGGDLRVWVQTYTEYAPAAEEIALLLADECGIYNYIVVYAPFHHEAGCYSLYCSPIVNYFNFAPDREASIQAAWFNYQYGDLSDKYCDIPIEYISCRTGGGHGDPGQE